MNGQARTIARNATVLMASQLITWVLAFVLTILLPRYLGAAAIGKLNLASSLLAITTVVSSFGMEVMVTKETARDPKLFSRMFGTAVILRFALFILSYCFLAGYVLLAGYTTDTLWVVAIYCISFLFDAIASLIQAAFYGLERMEFVSISMVITKIFYVGASIVLLLLGKGLLPIAAVAIGGGLINLIISFAAYQRVQPVTFRFDPDLAIWVLKNSLPYLMSLVALTLYMRIDVVIISLLVDEQQIGWYSAANTLFASTLFVPTIFMTAVFPILTRTFNSGSNIGERVIQKSFDMLLLLGVPVGLVVAAIANPLSVLLYGPEFENSGPILSVFGVTMVMTYLTILLGKYLVSIDRQNQWTVVMVVCALATIPLDLLLMPLCQRYFGNAAIGGALSFLITETGMVIAGFVLIPKGVLGLGNLRTAARITLAGLIMLLVVWLLRGYFVLIPIAVGGLVYAAGVLILRILTPEDWKLIKEITTGIGNRIRRRSSAATAATADGLPK